MVEGSREAGTPTWIRRGSTMLTMRGTPAGWSLLTGSSAWALHHSPRAVLAMLVLELAGLAVLQWQHGRLQAGSRQGAQAIVEILPDTRVVVIGADGSHRGPRRTRGPSELGHLYLRRERALR